MFLRHFYPEIGADPELFIRDSEGLLVDGETALKALGWLGQSFDAFLKPPLMVPDGVQVEIHPQQGACVASVANSLSKAMLYLASAPRKGFTADLTPTVDVSAKEFERMPPSARQLGCSPSFNVYEERGLGVPAGYSVRSAGGHVHVGLHQFPELMKIRKALVPLLDIVLGLPCVLLDRDPRAAERRTVYGRAGEYRLPSYGLEYRTLSNFWLRGYPLANFVFTQARFAVRIAYSSLREVSVWEPDRVEWEPKRNLAKDLISRIDLNLLQRAINESDFLLATHLWAEIVPFILEVTEGTPETSAYAGPTAPLCPAKMQEFDFLVQKGIDHYFPMSTAWWTTEWRNRDQKGLGLVDNFNDPAHTTGWQTFLTETIRTERMQQQPQVTLPIIIGNQEERVL